MTEWNQLPLPESFIALHVAPGRTRPGLAREALQARYEFCEDLATALTERAREAQAELGVSEDVVLERMGLGLADDASMLEPDEARWVVRRLAELLDWPQPDWPDDGRVDGGIR
jgi:hypothetical protein